MNTPPNTDTVDQSDFIRDDKWCVRECASIIDDSQQILTRGRDTFFDSNNSVEFAAARMAAIDLDVAVKGLSEEFKDAHPEIPWSAMARTRSKFAHYEDINRDLVWNMLTIEMPNVANVLRDWLDNPR